MILGRKIISARLSNIIALAIRARKQVNADDLRGFEQSVTALKLALTDLLDDNTVSIERLP